MAPGKRRGDEEAELPPGVEVRTPFPDNRKGEIFGIADQLMGGSRIRVICEDGQSRLSRVPGKYKRRMWIREGDLVIVKPWSFQPEKADVTYRYTKTQALQLKRKGRLPPNLDVF